MASAPDIFIHCLNIERAKRARKNLDLNDVCPLKIREICISILFYEYAYNLPQMLNTAYHRVGRQGTLLCKEINIGYL